LPPCFDSRAGGLFWAARLAAAATPVEADGLLWLWASDRVPYNFAGRPGWFEDGRREAGVAVSFLGPALWRKVVRNSAGDVFLAGGDVAWHGALAVRFDSLDELVAATLAGWAALPKFVRDRRTGRYPLGTHPCQTSPRA
jgi:hypothetical protein